MKYPICAVGAAALLAAVAAASPAHADLCDKFASMVVAARYVVQNNRWNDKFPGDQCIKVIDQGPGFAITKQTDSATPLELGPLSYPSIYIGCHYGNCSPGTNLPIQVKAIKKAQTRINSKYVDNAIFDASYDIWLDPTAKKDKVNQKEIMIWLNRRGGINPVGAKVADAQIHGRSWQVWSGFNSANDVISYVAPSAAASMDFDVLEFIADVIKRGDIPGQKFGKLTDAFYLTSIQAGFEPWEGGAGLAVESFQATVDVH